MKNRTGFISLPFGPREAGRLKAADGALDIAYPDVNATQQVEQIESKRAPIVIGRKGSGKTSLIHILKDAHRLCIEVDISDDFPMLSEFIKENGLNNHINAASNKWKISIWNQILKKAINFLSEKELLSQPIDGFCREYLNNLDSNFSDKAPTQTFNMVDEITSNRWRNLIKSSSLSTITQESVKKIIEEILDENELTLRVFIDTVEGYQIYDSIHAQTCLGGLIHCSKNITFDEKRFECILFLPDELNKFCRRYVSKGVLKDFEDTVFLKWSADELMNLAARKLHNTLKYYKIEGHGALGLSPRANVAQLIHEYMPTMIVDQSGLSVGAIPYILRHTQLNPRQFITTINFLCSNIFYIDNGTVKIRDSQSKIDFSEISEPVHDIYDDIVSTFLDYYPRAREIVERTVPYMPGMMSDDTLRGIFSSCGVELEFGLNYENFRAMLADIGVIGIVLKHNDNTCEGEFSYSAKRTIIPKHGERICVHPVFSYVHKSRSGVDIMVHPHGSSLEKHVFKR